MLRCPVPRQMMMETLVVKMLGSFRAGAYHVTSVGAKREHHDEAMSTVEWLRCVTWYRPLGR